MKLSRTAIKELKSRYYGIMKKCAYMNALVLGGFCCFSQPVSAFDFNFSDDTISTDTYQITHYETNTSSPTINNITSPIQNGGKWINSYETISFAGGKFDFSSYQAIDDGGSIYNKGRINFSVLAEVSFSNNKAQNGNGGAVWNDNYFYKR